MEPTTNARGRVRIANVAIEAGGLPGARWQRHIAHLVKSIPHIVNKSSQEGCQAPDTHEGAYGLPMSRSKQEGVNIASLVRGLPAASEGAHIWDVLVLEYLLGRYRTDFSWRGA
jgi:hypothetical protein